MARNNRGGRRGRGRNDTPDNPADPGPSGGHDRSRDVRDENADREVGHDPSQLEPRQPDTPDHRLARPDDVTVNDPGPSGGRRDAGRPDDLGIDRALAAGGDVAREARERANRDHGGQNTASTTERDTGRSRTRGEPEVRDTVQPPSPAAQALDRVSDTISDVLGGLFGR